MPLLALGGCGRRGPLEPPPAGAPDSQLNLPFLAAQPNTQPPAPAAPGSGVPANAGAASQSVAVQAANSPPPASLDASETQNPSANQVRPVKPTAVTPVNKSFILDPLLN
jgi:hypothetical protein